LTRPRGFIILDRPSAEAGLDPLGDGVEEPGNFHLTNEPVLLNY